MTARLTPTEIEIAAIVCKHVPPVRLCDRGETCSCWAEYALPAAREILSRFTLAGAWRDIASAPYEVPVLVWLYLPKNPIASAHAIASRCYVEADEPETFGTWRRTVGCWWSNGMYYAAGHVTHWMPLPSPPSPKET